MNVVVEPTIEMQIVELEQAGWTRYRNRPDMWRAPNGSLWLGPHGAWKALRSNMHLLEGD